jgi:hypothetical protein
MTVWVVVFKNLGQEGIDSITVEQLLDAIKEHPSLDFMIRRQGSADVFKPIAVECNEEYGRLVLVVP